MQICERKFPIILLHIPPQIAVHSGAVSGVDSARNMYL